VKDGVWPSILHPVHYFTREFADGDLRGGETEDAERIAAYEARIAAIAPRLPPSLARLGKELSLHDGLIESIQWTPAAATLEVSLVIGDLEHGYSVVHLVYGGAQLGEPRLAALRRAAESRHVEVLYDEVDIDEEDGLFVHRLLFWPAEQVAVEFDSFEMTVEPRADRRVALLSPFCVVDPED
jgi:hypothetical protein